MWGPHREGRSSAWRTLRPSELLERGKRGSPPLLRRHGSSVIGFYCFNTKEPFPLALAWSIPRFRAVPVPTPALPSIFQAL